MTIDQKLKKILIKFFKLRTKININSIKQSKVKNWDSLNHMNLFFLLEEEFKIKFSDKEILESDNFNKILKNLKKKFL